MAHARGGGRRWPKETKALIQSEFLLGKSESFLAKEHAIPLATVSYWVRNIPKKDLEELVRKNRTNYAELLLSCVECGAETFKIICESAREKSYLQKQEIGQVAVFTGVIADTVFNILEAMEPTEEQEQQPIDITAHQVQGEEVSTAVN